jgi:hypothetical protein
MGGDEQAISPPYASTFAGRDLIMTMKKEVYIARQSLVAELLSRVQVLNDKVDGQQELLGSLLRLHQEMRQGGNNRFQGTENGEREKRLAMAVQEAILGLDESRKAFKSKQLESIRHRLIKALSDAAAGHPWAIKTFPDEKPRP